ncbi:MAG: riboflavin synthase [Desulfitobacterium hafniense]|nr:riboflavin synthase [Desulfitobacterium hafniense]
MFTGIVEELGKVAGIKLSPDSAKLTIQAKKVLEGTKLGDSVAVNGVCLTVVEISSNSFTADVMAETVAKTNLADLVSGSPVNLERALQLSTRLGGHLVSGHVDGVGRLERIYQLEIAHVYEISAPSPLLPYVLPKGSIAIDGISLTVVEVKSNSFSVSLIPHTFKETTLGSKGIGSKVNLETDIIGKYVARFLERGFDSSFANQKSNLSLKFLAENGFLD